MNSKIDNSIFVGNLSDDVTCAMLRDLFQNQGVAISNVDIKSGFAFVYCDIETTTQEDIDEVIQKINHVEFGKLNRSITVAKSKASGEARIKQEQRRQKLEPTSSLFIVGFDTNKIKIQDIRNLFGKHGKILNVEIKKSFCFVEFSEISEATLVLETYHNQEVFGRNLVIEYRLNKSSGGLSSWNREDDCDRSYDSVSLKDKMSLRSGREDFKREPFRDERDRDRDRGRARSSSEGRLGRYHSQFLEDSRAVTSRERETNDREKTRRSESRDRRGIPQDRDRDRDRRAPVGSSYEMRRQSARNRFENDRQSVRGRKEMFDVWDDPQSDRGVDYERSRSRSNGRGGGSGRYAMPLNSRRSRSRDGDDHRRNRRNDGADDDRRFHDYTRDDGCGGRRLGKGTSSR